MALKLLRAWASERIGLFRTPASISRRTIGWPDPVSGRGNQGRPCFVCRSPARLAQQPVQTSQYQPIEADLMTQGEIRGRLEALSRRSYLVSGQVTLERDEVEAGEQ